MPSLSLMQQQQQPDPESEDMHAYPLDDNIFIPLQPFCSVSIPGREQSFLHCGEFIVLREHLAIDAVIDGESAVLHANVGQIICITPIGSSRRILTSLLVLASGFPIARIREGAAPPDRRQLATLLNGFLAARLSAKLLYLLQMT
jgi:hypothetical protein